MFLMIVSAHRNIVGHSIGEIVDQLIREAYFENEEEFVNSIDNFSFYELGEPLKIKAKFQETIYTIEK